MRVFSRIVLFAGAAMMLVPAVFASHFQADCPLQLVATNPPASAFYQSPHGVFRSGTQVFALRGQTVTTYTVTDLGDLTIAREDFVGALGARESNGGVAFSSASGLMYVSSEAGLEILDLRSVRPGGLAPALLTRIPGLHYRRMALNSNGTILAALYPATDLPCAPFLGSTTCFNNIDIYDVSNSSNVHRVGQITAFNSDAIAFNDVTFNYNILVATGIGGTFAYNVTNPATPTRFATDVTPGIFLASNGANFLAVGNDQAVLTYIINIPSPTTVFFNPFELHTLATLRVGRTNPIAFHHQAWIDDNAGRLITMVDEIDPHTLQPARTFAFDTFDYAVPMFEGSDPREYEQVSYTQVDEVKYNPVAVGPYIYVIGELSGLQSYGVCGQMDGRIEWDSPLSLPCGGAEIHGWVTGATKIANVEVFLDGGSLGAATLTGPPRIDIPSATPVTPWRISVNLDATPKGEHVLRAVATDILGNRRQISSVRVLFGGPGANCFTRRRASGK